MSKHTPLGPGTVSVKVGNGTAQQFAGECKAASITHEYEETGDKQKYLDDSERGATTNRTDGFTASLDNDLTSAGLYQFLITHDMQEATLEYTPNTASGAKWTGTVQLRLPAAVGAGEFGEMLASEVAWTGTLTFTAATATQAAK